jgi:hypothetical protein
MSEEKTPPIEFELYKGAVKGKMYPDSHRYYVNGKPKTGVTTFIGIKDKSRALMTWKGFRVVDYLLKKLDKGKIDEQTICIASYIDEIEKEEAADFGSKIHEWVEGYINFKLKKQKEMPEMPDIKQVQVGVNAFLDWEKEHKVKVISSERVVYSKKHDYIGKMDIEAIIDGDLCLVDLKSSNGLYNGVNLQTAGYVHADEEESEKEYVGRWAVRLSKYDEAEYYEREEKKKKIKQIICQARGREYKDYPIPPYQVFEAKYLDPEPGLIDRDFKAFLAAKHLYQWDKETDYFLNRLA